ncbi:Tryptophan synthase alpha chain [Candidatus Terasakiella magnetica]|uniref:Tryptophan synthase alpha chain n=1 Tax=Candidatus Terasakiella magnetica TaxID=1867952 RepID=A0A1C3RII0_9PROT|nr:tryptophan synthase subunit alpha [Candidatus Terasakiella magnetica]SCA57087.1 Tryptophan synthase alpha chain [Candidatus Terasakiella magnetica]
MSQTRLGKRFAALKAEGRSALVTFVSAGDPDLETSKKLIGGMAGAGADVLEIGMPFSDPMADGPAIQLGSQRALAAGMTLKGVLELVGEFRENDNDTPIVLMGYYNPIYSYGVEAFIAAAKEVGVDGFIIVDLPPEEEKEFALPAQKAGLDFIYLTTPTADDARLEMITSKASGFIYYVSITGVTGTASAATSDVESAVKRIRQFSELPVAIGFGINTPDQAKTMASISDAAVVGSAIVKQIAENVDENGKAKDGLVDAVLSYVKDLANGVRAAK